MPDDCMIDHDARLLLEYMRLDMPVQASDYIIGVGSSDIRTAEHAAKLYMAGYAPRVVFTGGRGKLTHDQEQTEAERFKSIAIARGVPAAAILIETEATNTGENVARLAEMLAPYRPKRLLIACKIYNERRVYATFKKQWPDSNTDIIVSSPSMTYDEYPNDSIDKTTFINLMVGDVYRIQSYARIGFQIPQAMPAEVDQALQRLIAAGFDAYVDK